MIRTKIVPTEHIQGIWLREHSWLLMSCGWRSSCMLFLCAQEQGHAPVGPATAPCSINWWWYSHSQSSCQLIEYVGELEVVQGKRCEDLVLLSLCVFLWWRDPPPPGCCLNTEQDCGHLHARFAMSESGLRPWGTIAGAWAPQGGYWYESGEWAGGQHSVLLVHVKE